MYSLFGLYQYLAAQPLDEHVTRLLWVDVDVLAAESEVMALHELHIVHAVGGGVERLPASCAKEG